MSGIIAVSSSSNGECFIGLSNGTARIWMSMSRDGLLPKRFSKYIKIQNVLRNNCHWFCSSSSSFVLNLTLLDLCSIGTLFAFVLVCAGVLVLQTKLIFLVENSKPLC
jgi:amino acid transporter